MNDLERARNIIAASEQFTPAIMERLYSIGFEKSVFLYKKKRMKPGDFWISKWDSGYSFVIVVNENEGLKKDPCDVGHIVEGNLFNPLQKKVVTYSLPEATRIKLSELKFRTGINYSDLMAEGIDDLTKLHESGKLNVEYAETDLGELKKKSYSFCLGAFEQLRKLKYETRISYVDLLIKAVDNLYTKHMEAIANEKPKI